MTAHEECILVSPVLPNPDGSGLEQRAFSLLRDLAARFQVTLLVADESACLPAGPPAVQSLAASIQHLRTSPESSWGRRAALCFPALVLLDRNWTLDWQRPGGPAPVLPARPAYAAFFRLRTQSLRAAVLAPIPPCPTLIDLDDLESKTLWSIGCFAWRRLRLRLALKHLSMACQYALLEYTLLRRFDVVTYANPCDRRALASVSGAATLLCRPNQVALPPGTTRPPAGSRFTLLFLGTLSYFPNEDAALWIADELVPALRLRGLSDFRLLIAGRGATQRLTTRLAEIPEVEFLGPVEHVGPLYAQSHVAVAAVRCGGGTKVKILEAAAYHCPVVATPHATLGLPFLPGQDLLEASDAQAFAACCIRLANQPDEASAMAERAYLRLTASLANSGAGSCSIPFTSR